MSLSTRDRTRWVLTNVDQLTVDTVKSMSYTVDQAVEYFARKITLSSKTPFRWMLPDDF